MCVCVRERAHKKTVALYNSCRAYTSTLSFVYTHTQMHMQSQDFTLKHMQNDIDKPSYHKLLNNHIRTHTSTCITAWIVKVEVQNQKSVTCADSHIANTLLVFATLLRPEGRARS